eukprot:Nk52_evm55s252 gene=Nk52_evmTU55s252
MTTFDSKQKLDEQIVINTAIDMGEDRRPSHFSRRSSRAMSTTSRMSTASSHIITEFQERSTRVRDSRRARKQAKKEAKKEAQKQQQSESKDDLRKEVDMDEHIVPVEELEERLQTSTSTGLTTSEAENKLALYGKNVLTPPKTTPTYILFLREIFTGFAIVLWAAAVLCFVGFTIEEVQNEPNPTNADGVSTNLTVGVVLTLVIMVTGTFSFYQNNKSRKVMEGFKNMVALETTVLRNGEKFTLAADELVIGDIVEVRSGDRVPADIRVLEATNFKVDNSSLTGESEPQKRFPKQTHDNPLETANIAFSTTTCVEGQCTGMVINTGDNTVIGRLATLVASAGPEETPMGREIRIFIFYITILAGSLGLLFFAVGMAWGEDWNLSVITMIGIIVANVPEGLPSIIAVSLTLAAKRMAGKNVLVTKQLQSVETMGRTSVICSDKTGTLTQNRMTVSHMFYDLHIKTSDPVADGSYEPDSATFQELYSVAALCSRSDFEADQEHVPVMERKVVGDASETAFLKFCETVKPVQLIRDQCPKIAEIPFNSSNKFQLSIHESGSLDDQRLRLVMKGAPERIVSRCTHIMVDGKPQIFDDKMKAIFQESYEKLGGLGERVLGLCSYRLPEQYGRDFEFDTDSPNFPMEGFCFVGLLSLIDPPRESVPGAILRCNTAGIKVVMVTGDHPLTAEAISRKIHLLSGQEGKTSIVVHGDALRDMTDEELNKTLDHDEIVFARTSPQQKLRIVEGFQKRGEVVAVTGDGVNDSPALKQADCGIAMGIAGSDVSKEAADLILLDDNFGSIVNGIEEGRVIFDNLKKSIAYSLSSKCPETIPFIFSTIFRLPTPLSPILVLSIDVGTDLLPAIALAYEKAEEGVMSRPPRDPKTDRLVTIKSICYSYAWLGLLQACAGMTSYFVLMYKGGSGNIVDGGCWYPGDLFFQTNWDNDSDNKIIDSCGKTWSFDDRQTLTSYATACYFVAVLLNRIGVLLMCKSTVKSLFTEGIKNKVIWMGLGLMFSLAAFLVYVPGVQKVFATNNLPYQYWLIPLPFCVLLICLEEIRKYFVRSGKTFLMY